MSNIDYVLITEKLPEKNMMEWVKVPETLASKFSIYSVHEIMEKIGGGGNPQYTQVVKIV